MELLQYIFLMINKELSQGGGIDEQRSGRLTRMYINKSVLFAILSVHPMTMIFLYYLMY